jgi:tetraacyldisaccharide 4'-kinase
LIRERLRGRLEGWLLRVWFRSASPVERAMAAVAAPVALPLSWLVAGVARRRRDRIVRQAPGAGVPVVVVGNLVAGGSGKTPLVSAIVRGLADAGFSPGILAGGYRARAGAAPAPGASDGVTLVDAASDAAAVGDEALLLAIETGMPLAVGKDRAAAAAALCRRHPDRDVLVSDDGLQHVGLARFIELVAIDERGFGNGRCLPAGPLREPVDRLESVDALIMTSPPTLAPAGEASPRNSLEIGSREPIPPHLRQFRSSLRMTAFVTLDGAARWSPEQFAAAHASDPLDALAGIARPARFFASLRALGLRPDCHPLPDHAAIDPRWLQALPGRWILMTAKDAVKCRRFDGGLLARCVRVDVAASPEPALLEWLAARLRAGR